MRCSLRKRSTSAPIGRSEHSNTKARSRLFGGIRDSRSNGTQGIWVALCRAAVKRGSDKRGGNRSARLDKPGDGSVTMDELKQRTKNNQDVWLVSTSMK